MKNPAEKIQKYFRDQIIITNPIKYNKNKNIFQSVGSTTSFSITPMHYGLHLQFLGKDTNDTIKVPGEIKFNKLVEIIRSYTECLNTKYLDIKESTIDDNIYIKPTYNPIYHNDLGTHLDRERRLNIGLELRASNLWKNRGFYDPEKKIPKIYWEKISSYDIKKFEPLETTQNVWKKKFDTWVFLGCGKENSSEESRNKIYQKSLETKIIPEVPWGVRKWSNFSLPSLARHTINGTIKSKQWAKYAASCLVFDNMLDSHNVFSHRYIKNSPLYRERDEFMQFLTTWSKTKSGVVSLDDAFNQGMNVRNILDLAPKTTKELQDFLPIWRKISDKERSFLDDSYQPPKIALKDGYIYVDHTNSMKISDLYNCCFSNSPDYINKICDGNGFAVYQPNFDTKKGDNGSLCFFVLNTNEKKPQWAIKEIRGYHNSETSEKSQNDMTAIARSMTITHPYKFPHLDNTEKRKEFLEDIFSKNEKYRKVFAYQDIPNYKEIQMEINNFCRVKGIQDAIRLEGYVLEENNLGDNTWTKIEPYVYKGEVDHLYDMILGQNLQEKIENKNQNITPILECVR